MKNRDTIMKLLVYLVLVFLASSCSIHGYYTTNPKSKSIAMAGYEIVLTKNKTFHIKSWTDNYSFYRDSLGNRIWKDPHYQGFGTFVQIGDSLELTFLNSDSISIEIFKTTEKRINNYRLSIINETGKIYSPIISLKDSSRKTVKTVFNKNKKYTEFQDSLGSGISIIGFDLHIFFSPKIIIPLDEINIGRNIFNYKTYNGYYPRGTKTNFYCKKAWSGIRYGPKKRWLAKKYKQNWLNKFYKD